jgi:hypothetical protein
MRLLITLIAMMSLVACSIIQPTLPNNDVTRLETVADYIVPTVQKDPCLVEVQHFIRLYLEGNYKDTEYMLKLAKTCKNEHLYLEVKWGIVFEEKAVFLNILRY